MANSGRTGKVTRYVLTSVIFIGDVPSKSRRSVQHLAADGDLDIYQILPQRLGVWIHPQARRIGHTNLAVPVGHKMLVRGFERQRLWFNGILADDVRFDPRERL